MPVRRTQYATGLNTDLLAATDAYRPGPGPGVMDFLTSSPMLAAFDTMCQQIKSRHRHRDVVGVTCQYHGCPSLHEATPCYASEFKYCGKCKQVMYCSEQCHKSDWPSHKQHCADIASLGLQKRELLRLPAALMETLSLVIMLRHWARAVLRLDQDRHAGLKQRIILTYTLAPRGSNGAQVLQLTHAELERTPHTLVCPGLAPLAHDTENVWIQLEFRADVPGMYTHYRTWTRISNYHLWLLPPEMAGVMASPLKCLTGLNKEIREDTKNCFGLRVIRE